jgi:hypothetical protein
VKTKNNFLDEIIACLVTRSEEWELTYEELTHTSGVSIRTLYGDVVFNPPISLTDQEKVRLCGIIGGLRRQDILNRLGVSDLTEWVESDHLVWGNSTFLANVLHSIRSDPDSWTLGGDTLKHTSGIEIWSANNVESRKFHSPGLEVAKSEKQLLQDAIEQHQRYSILKQINGMLPKIDAQAKTWGSRCPFCLEKPEKECYRCECDILLHKDCAIESEKCPICDANLIQPVEIPVDAVKKSVWTKIFS